MTEAFERFYWTPSGQSQTRWGSNPLECDVLNIGDHTTRIILLTGVELTVPTGDVTPGNFEVTR